MSDVDVRALLVAVRDGTVSMDDAQARLQDLARRATFEDLGFARVDHHRPERQGTPEVIYGEGKEPDQIAEIASRIVGRGDPLLVTRVSEHAFDSVRRLVPAAVFHQRARAITYQPRPAPAGQGRILVIAAGTSDLPVAEEAVVTATWLGNDAERLYDVGVAGIHRLLAEQTRLNAARVVIVVAGMEGALPSVVGGLVRVPVVAVPTSVGYGASFGGLAALLGMLTSCASGVSVVNIDNGFGAAVVASQINHLSFDPAPSAEPAAGSVSE